jgi:hypothetical protein
MAGLPESIDELERVAFELAERTDVIGKIEHHILIKSALNLPMVPVRSSAAEAVPRIVPASGPKRAFGANGSQVARSRKLLKRVDLRGKAKMAESLTDD